MGALEIAESVFIPLDGTRRDAQVTIEMTCGWEMAPTVVALAKGALGGSLLYDGALLA